MEEKGHRLTQERLKTATAAVKLMHACVKLVVLLYKLLSLALNYFVNYAFKLVRAI